MQDVISTKKDFSEVLEDTIEQTSALCADFPEIKIYNSVLAQLQFIKKVIILEKRKPTEEECDSIMIGNMAVKNFEDEMPEYSRKLVELDYYFEFYDEL